MDVNPFEITDTSLLQAYTTVRNETVALCQNLEIEDYVIQAMPDVSPPLWHLMHSSWFFETFLLKPFVKNYQLYNKDYLYLFNSYYQTQGKFFPRHQRGFLSRPTVAEALKYRNYIDQLMQELLTVAQDEKVVERTTLGIQHEQQHQELLLTDIKYNFASNPLRPIYSHFKPAPSTTSKMEWISVVGGLQPIGHSAKRFAFDNECPQHTVFLDDFLIASRLVSNSEYIEFITAGGYEHPKYWLSDGWDWVQNQKIVAPLYWEKINGEWWYMTLSGIQPVDPHAPVCHVNYYEADAFARFAGQRLPTEAEWETAAANLSCLGNFRETAFLRPISSTEQKVLSQFFGDVWEWCQSAYLPYPGYCTPPDAFGEYNSKFMCNQMTLRGGSCVTPANHIRLTYRNFFYPDKRWQFSGIRLAAKKQSRRDKC